MYMRFFVCLAIGLFGLGLLLKTLLDSVFLDWDFSSGLRAYFVKLERKRHYAKMYRHSQEAIQLTTRLPPVHKQREREKPRALPSIRS